MKALLTLLLGAVVLTGCASPSTSRMSEEDRLLWDNSGGSQETKPPDQ